MTKDENAKVATYQEKCDEQAINYSKNSIEHDDAMVESALKNYSYEIGNPRQALQSTDVFEIIESSVENGDLRLTLKRTDGNEFRCLVKALSLHNGKWALGISGEIKVGSDAKDDIATTVMTLSESKKHLTPVNEGDLLSVARHIETERREEISNHNHSYAKAQYKARAKEAFSIKMN